MKLDEIKFSEHLILQELCKTSFYHFIKEFWFAVSNEEPIWNWHVKFIADECQQVAERLFAGKKREYDLLVNVPPGSTKSTIISVMFPAWCWIRKPDTKILGVSFTSSLSESHARKNINILNSNKYKILFPEVEITKEAITEVINSKLGERHAIGINGSITGKHFHFILIDDPLDPTQAVSKAELESINSAMKDVLPTRKINKETCPMIMVMQRLSQDDPSAKWLENSENGEPLRHICLPGELFTSSRNSELVKPQEVLKFYKDGLLDCKRLTSDVLRSYRNNMSPYAYSGQILQSPAPTEGGMFSPDKIVHDVNVPPDWQFSRIVRAWDKGGTDGGGDPTGGIKVGLHKDTGQFWILDYVEGQWESGKRENVIKSVAFSDGEKVEVAIEQELGSGGKHSANVTLLNLAEVGCKVHVLKPTQSKSERADPVSTFINREFYRCNKKSKWWKIVEEELRYFPNAKHDEVVDTLAYAHQILVQRKFTAGSF